jgi:hypothetical protein
MGKPPRPGSPGHQKTCETECSRIFPHSSVRDYISYIFLLLTISISPESYSKADKALGTGKPLDIGISGQETPGNSKQSDGFFEKAILKAPENDHTAKGNALEVKVIGNGHCHGILFISYLNTLAADRPV